MRTVLQSYSGLGYTVNPVLPSTVTSGGTPYVFQASAPLGPLSDSCGGSDVGCSGGRSRFSPSSSPPMDTSALEPLGNQETPERRLCTYDCNLMP